MLKKYYFMYYSKYASSFSLSFLNVLLYHQLEFIEVICIFDQMLHLQFTQVPWITNLGFLDILCSRRLEVCNNLLFMFKSLLGALGSQFLVLEICGMCLSRR